MKKAAHPLIRRVAFITALGTAAALAGCYVVPINPQTGQPYPPPTTAHVVTPAVPVNTSTVLQAKLYPMNPQATRAGALVATATDNHNGRGVFSLSFMGEVMHGDASRVDAGHPGFGRIYREVLGAGGDSVRGGHRGIANAVGTGGSTVQCEYHMTSKDIGTGVCLFSNGAKYQMHFGA